MAETPLESKHYPFFIHQASYCVSRVPNKIVSPAATPSIELHHRISPFPKAIASPDASNHLTIKLSPSRLVQTNQITLLPLSAFQETVFDLVPFFFSWPFSFSSSKSLTLLTMFIDSHMQTYTFLAHYATFYRVQLIIIAPLTIIHLTLIISSSPSSIIAPVMLIYTCPAYFQSCFPSGAVNCPFLHHFHYKPSSRLLLMSQSDHRTNSADLHRPDHFSRHFNGSFQYIAPPLLRQPYN